MNDSCGYPVPASIIEIEYEVKKSRFLARAGKAGDRGEAMSILTSAQTDYPDARHHCWAYQFGPPHSPHSAAMSDDGEPGGTAGKPILNVLQHKHVGDVMLVVSRYFGGIKLGAGGLVRAYSQAAQMAIDALPVCTQVLLQSFRLEAGFELEQPLRHLLKNLGGQVDQVHYREGILCEGQLPAAQWSALESFVLAHQAKLLTDEPT